MEEINFWTSFGYTLRKDLPEVSEYTAVTCNFITFLSPVTFILFRFLRLIVIEICVDML